MADPIGVTQKDGLCDRLCPGCFTGVNGDPKQSPGCTIEGTAVCARRPARFTAGQIEGNHAPIPERDRTFRELERYGGIVVPERAIDHAGNDTEVPLPSGQTAQLCLHHLLQA
jgi:hypothetical protein